MDLEYSASELALIEKLRPWLARVVPTLPPEPEGDDWEARRARDSTWQGLLHAAGYAGLSWPAAYGGQGVSAAEELVFLEEVFRAGGPALGTNFVGLMHAGPTLIVEGSTEQKQRHLPLILRGEEMWCQGFSEPGAGSDLASLSTRAVRDGDSYVVNGQKIWSSMAPAADFGELLVRTDPDASKHRGITYLIVDMHSPGIEIRPIRTIMGHSEFCEVFYNDVHVPVTNRVGAENDGWRVAMVTLGFERGTAFVGELLAALGLVDDIIGVARSITTSSGTAWDDPGLRRDVAKAAAQLDALWSLTKWNVSAADAGGVPDAGGSVLKLHLGDTCLELSRIALGLLGRLGVTLDDLDPAVEGSGALVAERLAKFALTIGGGTAEIQRNIIAERILGLPKEPKWTSS